MKHSDRKYIKSAFKEIYAAPEPLRKSEFLRGIKPSGISNTQFIMSQILYIRKFVWILSVVLIGMLTWLSGYVSVEILWPVTASMPFVAMIAVSENMRSNTYKMTELEMASRFSLKSIIFARMTAIGIFHMILLLILAFFTGANAELDFFKVGVYLLVPYLMTAVISMHVSRKLRGNEVNYVCMGIATIVAAVDAVLQGMVPYITDGKCFKYWIMVLVVLTVCTVMEYRKNIFRMEEALWSL